MKAKKPSDLCVRSLEVYRMVLPHYSVLGRQLKGACLWGGVLFGEQQAILSILPPMPTAQELWTRAAEWISQRQSTREQGPLLVSLKKSRRQMIQSLESFCNEGEPLWNPFQQDEAQVSGLTAFQAVCYQKAVSIPHGETRSYAWLAEKLKKPGAERAVGGAMRHNPFPLLIPCHRIVLKNGHLGGFMGSQDSDSWQVFLKRALLDLEESHRQPSLFVPVPSQQGPYTYAGTATT